MSRYDKIEFAPKVAIEQYEDLAYDFLNKIFGIKGAFITDESSLSDFMDIKCDDEDWSNDIEELVKRPRNKVKEKQREKEYKKEEQQVIKKIKEIYKVDVSDIEDLLLVKIFERIRILKSL